MVLKMFKIEQLSYILMTDFGSLQTATILLQKVKSIHLESIARIWTLNLSIMSPVQVTRQGINYCNVLVFRTLMG